VITLPTEGQLADLRFVLEDRFGPIDEVRQEANIGPVVSAELAQQALILLVLGSAGILGWMTFRFADFRMGASAIAALIHDVVVVVGIFAILGTVVGLEIDALFVTAILTVIGFSVHDTIVVFDRIRENRVRHAGEPFAAIVNHSLLQTLGRSLNTSLTVVMVLLAMLLFGSDAIRSFVFAMVVGIISGTYSSIFNASMLLVTWHERDERRRAQQFSPATARR
jgi:preprotein translocase subunit SecF